MLSVLDKIGSPAPRRENDLGVSPNESGMAHHVRLAQSTGRQTVSGSVSCSAIWGDPSKRLAQAPELYSRRYDELSESP